MQLEVLPMTAVTERAWRCEDNGSLRNAGLVESVMEVSPRK